MFESPESSWDGWGWVMGPSPEVTWDAGVGCAGGLWPIKHLCPSSLRVFPGAALALQHVCAVWESVRRLAEWASGQQGDHGGLDCRVSKSQCPTEQLGRGEGTGAVACGLLWALLSLSGDGSLGSDCVTAQGGRWASGVGAGQPRCLPGEETPVSQDASEAGRPGSMQK